MRQSRLVQILKVLSTKERTRFKEYTFSPFFNKNKKVQLLCEYVLKHAPKFQHARLQRTLVHQVIFENQVYKDSQINNVISDLLQLLYQFLAYLHFEEKEAIQKNFLLEKLLEREVHHDFDRVAKSYQGVQEKSAYRNYEFHLDEYHRYDKLDRFFFTKGKRSFDENLQLKNNSLDHFYFSNKFRIACDMSSRNIVAKAQYQCHYLEELLQQSNTGDEAISNQPVIRIYKKILQMLKSPKQEKYYFEAKELIQTSHPLFPQEELRILYTFLINYSIKKINSGQTNFTKELLEIYKSMLRDNIIFRNGYLPHWPFKNITSVGIRLKEFEWTENFILNYQKHLHPEGRENAVTYNLTMLFYAKKDYSRALQQLHNVNFTDDNYHLGSKVIQIKSYFELGEMEALLALLEASKKFINRSKQIPDYLKTTTLNFVKMAKKLCQLRVKKEILTQANFKQKQLELLDLLREMDALSQRDWLEAETTTL